MNVKLNQNIRIQKNWKQSFVFSFWMTFITLLFWAIQKIEEITEEMYDIEIPWEPTNEVDKHTVAVMRSNSLVKESVGRHIPQNISKFSLMFLFFFFFFFFFYLGFPSRTFTIYRAAGEGGGYLFNSSQPLPPTSQAFRHQQGNYCREFISAHSLQPDSNRERLVSKRKSLFTKLRALKTTKLRSLDDLVDFNWSWSCSQKVEPWRWL